VLRLSRYDKTAAISSPRFTWQILSLGSMEHRQRSQQINTSYRYLRLQPAYATIAFSHKEERECDKPAAEVIYAVVCMEGARRSGHVLFCRWDRCLGSAMAVKRKPRPFEWTGLRGLRPQDFRNRAGR
jgi:hypothetical protein